MVERDPGKQVMDDMVVDNLVEEMAADEAESAVHRAQSAFNEGPCFFIIMRYGGVGVMQVSDSDYFKIVKISGVGYVLAV